MWAPPLVYLGFVESNTRPTAQFRASLLLPQSPRLNAYTTPRRRCSNPVASSPASRALRPACGAAASAASSRRPPALLNLVRAEAGAGPLQPPLHRRRGSAFPPRSLGSR
uniref:Uncharacterized protein n=1 Tax=Leersia perrieri TaxID=77586 RepID=A0A0D9XQL3_9ORYZ